METFHKVYYKSSADMKEVESGSVDLVVTSPPYPMIAMWDEIFTGFNPAIKEKLLDSPFDAFELMHKELDKVWHESYRVLKAGGIACINIGDAARTINGTFTLYPNHSRIFGCLVGLGFNPLPLILWRKQTNAPNKFMGSGMLAPGAYVTLEHEYIIIARKGDKMEFNDERARENRRESAYFWEERNQWFSDVWLDLKGTPQKTNNKDLRQRSGAFPFELPYRLINMFSMRGGTVVDPFFGLGTTTLAAMAACRNSIGYEVDETLAGIFASDVNKIVMTAGNRIESRLRDHVDFVEKRQKEKGKLKYTNIHYGFPVMTRQETNLRLYAPSSVRQVRPNEYQTSYDRDVKKDLFGYWD